MFAHLSLDFLVTIRPNTCPYVVGGLPSGEMCVPRGGGGGGWGEGEAGC